MTDRSGFPGQIPTAVFAELDGVQVGPSSQAETEGANIYHQVILEVTGSTPQILTFELVDFYARAPGDNATLSIIKIR